VPNKRKWLALIRRELAEQKARCAADPDKPRQLTDSDDARELIARLDRAIEQIKFMRDSRDCWNTTALAQIDSVIRELRA
jgi:hypothetical protein